MSKSGIQLTNRTKGDQLEFGNHWSISFPPLSVG